jgi:hypothetical protein
MTISLIKAIRAAANEVDALEILRAAQDLEDQAQGRTGTHTEASAIDLGASPDVVGREIWQAIAQPVDLVLMNMPPIAGQRSHAHMMFWNALIHEVMTTMVLDMGLDSTRAVTRHLVDCKQLEDISAAVSSFPAPIGQQVH